MGSPAMAQFKSVPVTEKPDDHSTLPEVGLDTFQSVLFLLVGIAALAICLKLFFGFLRRRRKALINAIIAEELGAGVDMDSLLRTAAEQSRPAE
jgi:hypothetical protein